jgi:ribosomal protein S18 acetylase RimI-like enzyme
MSESIEVQECVPDDWRAWSAVRLAALAEAPYAYGTALAQWDGADEQRWRARLTSVPFNALAKLSGRPAGIASGVPEDDGTITLISMWVAPFARGRGVGDRLVQSVVEWARELGEREVRLHVVENNAAAIALYLRNGFADAGRSANADIEGVPQREMIYRFVSSR